MRRDSVCSHVAMSLLSAYMAIEFDEVVVPLESVETSIVDDGKETLSLHP